MIPSFAEISSSLYGAWRLICLDEKAAQHFNLSMEGFWRSFFAAVISLPYFVVAIRWPPTEAVEGGMEAPDPVLSSLAYLLSWVVFPVVAIVLVRMFELAQGYIGYIIAYNWAGALIAQPLLVLAVIEYAGLIDSNTMSALQMPIFIFVLWYGWIIARRTLGAGPWMACALVFIAKMIDILLFVALIGLAS